MSRAREAEQQLAANYYGFDGFPESMFVFFFFGPFSEARLAGSFREVLCGPAFFLGRNRHARHRYHDDGGDDGDHYHQLPALNLSVFSFLNYSA